MEDQFSLDKKHILLTGASSGIGRACAIEFSNQGAWAKYGVELNKFLQANLN